MAASDPANTLAHALRRQQVRILRTIQHVNGTVQKRLTGVRVELVKLAAAGDPTEPSRLGDQLNRVDAITVDARKLAGSTYRSIASETAAATADVVGVDQRLTADLVTRTTGDLGVTTLPRRVLERLVDRALIAGAPSAEWWRRQAADVAKRFHDQVREGVQAGESIGQIMRRVRGTGPNYLDGVMGVSQRNAEALVRTSVLSAQHDVRMEEFRQNADVVRGWTISTTFDSRTCLAGETPITTAGGTCPIRDIKIGDMVKARSGEYRPVLAVRRQHAGRLYVVRLSNGQRIRCTADHRFLDAGGNWIEARELCTGLLLHEGA